MNSSERPVLNMPDYLVCDGETESLFKVELRKLVD